jgi:peptidoglycan hydrolase-like protein with peptidoglycan-binding domain
MKQNTIYIFGGLLIAVAIYFYIKNKDKKTTEIIPEPMPAPTGKCTSTGTKAPTSNAIDRYKILKIGSTGNEVKILQNFLKPFSFNKIVADGNFGKITETYLASYKQNKGFKSNPTTTSIYELNADGKGVNIYGL